jgi:hypothetical protein
MKRLLWYGNSSGSDRNPNSSDDPVCLSVQSYGTYCQQLLFLWRLSIMFTLFCCVEIPSCLAQRNHCDRQLCYYVARASVACDPVQSLDCRMACQQLSPWFVSIHKTRPEGELPQVMPVFRKTKAVSPWGRSLADIEAELHTARTNYRAEKRKHLKSGRLIMIASTSMR